MDITQFVGSIGVPGVLCFLILKSFNDLRKAIDDNTKVLFLLAGQMGLNINETNIE